MCVRQISISHLVTPCVGFWIGSLLSAVTTPSGLRGGVLKTWQNPSRRGWGSIPGAGKLEEHFCLSEALSFKWNCKMVNKVQTETKASVIFGRLLWEKNGPFQKNQSKEKHWLQFRGLMYYYGFLWILYIISCKVKRLKWSLTFSCIISITPNNFLHLIMFTVDILLEKCAAVLLCYSFPHYYFINIWLTVIAAA